MFTRDLVVAKRRPVVVWIHGGSFSRFVHISSPELEIISYRGSVVEYDPDLLIFLLIFFLLKILEEIIFCTEAPQLNTILTCLYFYLYFFIENIKNNHILYRGSAAEYDPDYLLDQEIVLVTLQYRFVQQRVFVRIFHICKDQSCLREYL